MRCSLYCWSCSVCSITEAEVAGSKGSLECSSRVVDQLQCEAVQPRKQFIAQPQTKTQTFSSSSRCLVHSNTLFFFPCEKPDGEPASQREWPPLVRDSRHQINWDLLLFLDQVCMIRNKNSSEETNLSPGRIVVLIVSYLYDNLIFLCCKICH